uniref:cohesin subunit SA-1-like n=1 Tax=Panthera onca TaxID=9690 RepID=UPI0029531460
MPGGPTTLAPHPAPRGPSEPCGGQSAVCPREARRALTGPRLLAALTSQQERVLIEILVAAVRQAAEGHPPAGRELGKRAAREVDGTRRWRERASMSRHFVKVLPQLLSKFAADKEKVTPLLQIPQYCNLDVYDKDGLGSVSHGTPPLPPAFCPWGPRSPSPGCR